MEENTDIDTLWHEGADPLALLADVYPPRTSGSTQPQERKCRLYLLACARRQWHRLPGVCRGLVELAEHFAENPRDREPLRAALAPIAEMLMNSEGGEEDLALANASFGHATPALLGPEHLKFSAFYYGARELDSSIDDDEWRGLAALVYLPLLQKTPPFGWVPREMHSVALLREIYYNPHLFVPFHDEWRTSNVLAIARHVYDAREFSGMPILGDALEEAGCDCPVTLGHCRDAPVDSHARGCWVLDRVLR